MNPLTQFEGNPGFEDEEDHGDLWKAINRCYTRVAVVDERVRVALMFGLPVLGILVSVQLTCLGLIVTVLLV